MSEASASVDGRYDVLAAACPTRQVVNRLGDKWTLLVLCALESEALRFRALQRVVEGISQRMLTQTLRALERDGLVHRTVHPTAPPSVEYCLTDLGRSLSTVVAQVRHWAYGHIDEVEHARAQFDLTVAGR
jgi:DNA-binding HxlR family transcriptional regulator